MTTEKEPGVMEDLVEMKMAIREMKDRIGECKEILGCLLKENGSDQDPTPSLKDAVPVPYKVFVFGSNLAGRHGKGAALFAKMYRGAIYGQGEGRQGNSYGIPTKDKYIQTLPLEEVKKGVDRFLEYARSNPDVSFEVTKIGCGLAGFQEKEIAPMFAGAPVNCYLPEGWRGNE